MRHYSRHSRLHETCPTQLVYLLHLESNAVRLISSCLSFATESEQTMDLVCSLSRAPYLGKIKCMGRSTLEEWHIARLDHNLDTTTTSPSSSI